MSLFALLLLPAATAAPQDPPLSPSDHPSVESEWYLPTTDGKARLYVWEVGEGSPVLVVHGGFGAEHSYLYDPLRGLAGDHRLIFYDQRGSLRSPSAPEDISFEKHLDDLDLVRAELGLERVAIFAHSMGTVVALHYLSARPDAVGNLVLSGALRADTSFVPVLDTEAQEFFRRPEIEEELVRVRDSGLRGARLETALWRVQFAGANTFHVERWRRMKGGQVFYSQVAGSAAGGTLPDSWDLTPAIAAHSHRVTVINGSHDFVDFGGEYWSEAADGLPELSYVLVEEAGHNAWIDEPEVFAQALAAGFAAETR
jgi:pimeloyl-ACP methyl ester carboxylesterase